MAETTIDPTRVATAQKVFEKALEDYVTAWDALLQAREAYGAAVRRLAGSGAQRAASQFDSFFDAETRLAEAQRDFSIKQAHFNGAATALRNAQGRVPAPGLADVRLPGIV